MAHWASRPEALRCRGESDEDPPGKAGRQPVGAAGDRVGFHQGQGAAREQRRQGRRHCGEAAYGDHHVGAMGAQGCARAADLAQGLPEPGESAQESPTHDLLAGQCEQFEARFGDEPGFEPPLRTDEENIFSALLDDFSECEGWRDVASRAPPGDHPIQRHRALRVRGRRLADCRAALSRSPRATQHMTRDVRP